MLKLFSEQGSLQELRSEVTAEEDMVIVFSALISALIGSRAEGTEFEDAIDQLGVHRVKKAALGASAVLAAESHRGNLALDVPAYRRRLLCMALMVESMAQKFQSHLCPDAFVAGLLADIGYTYLCEALDTDMMLAFQTSGEGTVDLVESERYYVGMDHASAGAIIAEECGLRGVVPSAVASHHRPELTDGDEHRLASLCAVAGWMCDRGDLKVGSLAPNQSLRPGSIAYIAGEGDHGRAIMESFVYARNTAESALGTSERLLDSFVRRAA